MTKIYYYISSSGNNPVKKFINSLSNKQKSKIARTFAHILVHGLGTYIPFVKKLTGSNFWEIRILGQDNIRIIYAVIYKGDVLLLNGFVKKKQKTPTKELGISETRFLDWQKFKTKV